ITCSLPTGTTLAVVAAAALALDWIVPSPWPGLLLGGAAVLAYLAGALLFLTWSRSLGSRAAAVGGVSFLGLALCGLLVAPLHEWLFPLSWRAGVGFVDSAVQVLIALCLVALFVAEEREYLHG